MRASMSDLNTRCLDAFPEWLKSLPEDAIALADLLSSPSLPDASKRHIAGALNYLFKSLDLIPDGIEDLGFLDDAFVIRVAARVAINDLSPASVAFSSVHEGAPPVLSKLAKQADLVEELLAKDFVRLAKYVDALVEAPARGRTPDELVKDEGVRSAFTSDLAAWAQSYQAPSFTRDDKNLVKLTSFLSAKLPG